MPATVTVINRSAAPVTVCGVTVPAMHSNTISDHLLSISFSPELAAVIRRLLAEQGHTPATGVVVKHGSH